MRLEDELGTTKFKNEAHKAHINLFFTASWLKNRMIAFFRPFDLTMEQYNVLRIVRGAGSPIMVKDISDRMIEQNSNTTRIIDRLEKKNLLKRNQCNNDRRSYKISLTDQGKSLLAKIDDVFEKQDPHRTALNYEQCAQLNHLLDGLREEI